MTTTPTTSNSSAADTMPDVQARADARQVPIDRVGVKDVTYPMRLHSRDGSEQHTVATINMFVALPHNQKGTHMSRFLEVLNEHVGEPVCPEPDSSPSSRSIAAANPAAGTGGSRVSSRMERPRWRRSPR